MGNNLYWLHFPLFARNTAALATILTLVIGRIANAQEPPSATDVIAPLWKQCESVFDGASGFRIASLETIPMTISGSSGEGALTAIIEARPETLIPLWPSHYDRITGSLVIAQKGFRASGINPAEPREDRVGVAGEAAVRVMQNVGPALLKMDPERMTLLDEAITGPELEGELTRVKSQLRLPERSELEGFVTPLPLGAGSKENLLYAEFHRVLSPILESEIGDKQWLAETKSALSLFGWHTCDALSQNTKAIEQAVAALAELAGPYSNFISKLGVKRSGLRFAIHAPLSVKWRSDRWDPEVIISAKDSSGAVVCREFQGDAIPADSPDAIRTATEYRKGYDAEMAKLDSSRAALAPAMKAAVRAAVDYAEREERRRSREGQFSTPRAGDDLSTAITKALENYGHGKIHPTDKGVFQPYDLVELKEPAPLLFLEKVMRMGAAGDRFQVVQARPAERRVFLSTADLNGKGIAVSVNEDAVRLVDSGENQIATRLRVLASEPSIDRAVTFLAEVITRRPDLARFVEMRKVGEQVAALRRGAREQRDRALTHRNKALQLRKNAAVTDRPDPLISGGTAANMERAEKLRQQADEFEAVAEKATSEAGALEAQASELLNSFRDYPTR